MPAAKGYRCTALRMRIITKIWTSYLLGIIVHGVKLNVAACFTCRPLYVSSEAVLLCTAQTHARTPMHARTGVSIIAPNDLDALTEALEKHDAALFFRWA